MRGLWLPAPPTFDLVQLSLLLVSLALPLRLVPLFFALLGVPKRSLDALKLVSLLRGLIAVTRGFDFVLGRALLAARGVSFLAQALAVAGVATDPPKLGRCGLFLLGRPLPFLSSLNLQGSEFLLKPADLAAVHRH